MIKLISALAILAMSADNVYAISFDIPGVMSVHIGEGGSPFRPPGGGGGGGVGSFLTGLGVITGVNVGEKLEQLGNAIHEVVLLGKPGRDRDNERAEAAQREANAVREGENKAKSEKRVGLVRSIEIANRNVQDWQDVQAQGPAVVASYDRLFAVAQKELQTRTTMDANLRAAKNSANDAGLALRILGSMLSPAATQKPEAANGDDIHGSLDEWSAGGDRLEQIAKEANMSSTEFVSRAIDSADENSLQQFVSVVGQTRAQIAALVQMSDQKLAKARATAEDLGRELAALN